MYFYMTAWSRQSAYCRSTCLVLSLDLHHVKQRMANPKLLHLNSYCVNKTRLSSNLFHVMIQTGGIIHKHNSITELLTHTLVWSMLLTSKGKTKEQRYSLHHQRRLISTPSFNCKFSSCGHNIVSIVCTGVTVPHLLIIEVLQYQSLFAYEYNVIVHRLNVIITYIACVSPQYLF